ncbi:MAG: YraN family protein [Phycisphaerales bacterium]|nr:YraN family protein [Phycisphaerales bacterium]
MQRWTPSRWLARAFSKSPHHLCTGKKGERLAQRWLQRRGYRTVARNMRLGADEIDLLMWAPRREALVIVEVKTRVLPRGASGEAHNPLDSMTSTKQARQMRAGQQLIARLARSDQAIRFDVVSVRLPDGGRPVVEHYVSAFDHKRGA